MNESRSAEPLTREELSRTTLQRQHLLHPAGISEIELTEHLVGLQAQNPWSWYIGFFRRIEEVRPRR